MIEVPARTALAGNPSDAYGGAVVAVTVTAFAARAEVVPGARVPAGEEAIVEAAVARFGREFLSGPGAALQGCRVRWSTAIPRSVGLGGSSAIVIAVLRALCEHHGMELDADQLAELALSIEVDDLGIAAGPQDRVVQARGGLLFMDFGVRPPWHERLPAERLPPLLIAWREDAGEASGVVHGGLRARWQAGEPEVVSAMRRLGGCARAARSALLGGDLAALRLAVDATFDLRAQVLALHPRHVELIAIARAAGAAANYTGSGGAIVCLCHDLRHRDAVAQALREAGCRTSAQ